MYNLPWKFEVIISEGDGYDREFYGIKIHIKNVYQYRLSS